MPLLFITRIRRITLDDDIARATLQSLIDNSQGVKIEPVLNNFDALKSVGDLNGDGELDLVLERSSSQYHIYLSTRESNGYQMRGESSTFSFHDAGRSLEVRGIIADVNDDGTDELLVKYNGTEYIVFGRKDWFAITDSNDVVYSKQRAIIGQITPITLLISVPAAGTSHRWIASDIVYLQVECSRAHLIVATLGLDAISLAETQVGCPNIVISLSTFVGASNKTFKRKADLIFEKRLGIISSSTHTSFRNFKSASHFNTSLF